MKRLMMQLLTAICLYSAAVLCPWSMAPAQAQNLELVGRYNTPGEAIGVTVSGSLAYIADEGGGFRIVDVSNPAAPQQLGALPTPQPAQDVAVVGTLALVTAGGQGCA